ncbi:MAG: aldo/keto reductase, partial [Pseudomonadota bacterium]|nr:aldo/keto reductase [Pseudomonadota bacterium]
MRIITPEHGLFAVSNIIFGCGAVGGLLINGKDEEKQDTFELAISSGVNWFDTAPSYGAGVSESALGCLLTTADAAIQVSTKVSIDSRDSDYYGQVERSLSDSLRRL